MLVTYSFIVCNLSHTKNRECQKARNFFREQTKNPDCLKGHHSLSGSASWVFMDKHKCKLCFKNFSNGKALGGHMRSHMMNLPLPPKSRNPTIQLSFEAESASSSSSEDESSKLRENPKRSVRFGDPEFSFPAGSGSVILQDGESETESKNVTKRRSRRIRKFLAFEDQYEKKNIQDSKQELSKKLKNESPVSPEQTSSISDITTPESVAFCLMMLSRDKWEKIQKDREKLQLQEDKVEEEEEEPEDEDEGDFEDSDESEGLKLRKNRTRSRYKCETCNKTYRSYQALGGHRAGHKKIKLSHTVEEDELQMENNAVSSATMADNKKIHECPVCFRVFSSGQALGGHKRTHVIAPTTPTSAAKLEGNVNLIDLNLPAPVDGDDDISQMEYSAVSDAEFVKPNRH